MDAATRYECISFNNQKKKERVMKQPVTQIAALCLVVLFALTSCTGMNISNKFCPGVGVSVGAEQADEPETEVIMRVENPTGVVFI
ncbi:MAG TPA: hypothetical protein VEZ17_11895 [Chitinophagaceae bacterium]|nr:hypothetical protein [Chitinophagaceae bacterium]